MGASSHSDELPEPKTPMWLPFVGAALFLFVALFWLASSAPPEGSAPAASATAAPTAAPRPTQIRVAPGGRPKGAPAGH